MVGRIYRPKRSLVNQDLKRALAAHPVLVATTMLLLIFAYLATVYAKKEWQTEIGTGSGSSEFWSCDSLMTSAFVWDYTPLGIGRYSSYYDAVCGYPPCTGSTLICAKKIALADDRLMDRVYHVAADNCGRYSSYQHDWTYYRDMYENATKYVIDESQITNTSLPVYNPVDANLTSILPTYQGYVTYYRNLDDGTWFSLGCLAYFAVIGILATAANFFKQTGLIRSFHGPIINYFRSYVTTPAMIPRGSYKQPTSCKLFESNDTNRVEMLVAAGLSLLQVIYYLVPYEASDTLTLRRYIADRSGILAFGKLPLLIVFAGRNNFLSYFTGMKYSSSIIYHKLVARWMFIDALVHSICYTLYCGGLGSASFALDLEDLYFKAGVSATALCGGILFFALNPFRKYTYELFLYFHILLVIAFIAMCWYHCNELGWCEWLFASMAAWVADRLLRIVRMCNFGYPKAELQAFGTNSFRLRVIPPSRFRTAPGQYCFLYFADWLLFFQNHPFTLIDDGEYLSMYIIAKKGITSRILNEIRQHGGKMTKRVCMEGPYGEAVPVLNYDNALMLAGGSGVPGIVDSAIRYSQGKTKIKFVWVERTFADAAIYITDLVSKLSESGVEINLYLTREDPVDGPKDGDTSSSETVYPYININYGRPDIYKLVQGEVAEMTGSVAILVCGPGKMDDTARAAAADIIKTSTSRVDFYDELQTW